mmetsp:Transcript_14549/g.34337  ORF Transcript_14549/g.34337 Transcript_14549/m.34337 type:complete len:220 (+) Transcript_14549:403-1062(+)
MHDDGRPHALGRGQARVQGAARAARRQGQGWREAEGRGAERPAAQVAEGLDEGQHGAGALRRHRREERGAGPAGRQGAGRRGRVLPARCGDARVRRRRRRRVRRAAQPGGHRREQEQVLHPAADGERREPAHLLHVEPVGARGRGARAAERVARADEPGRGQGGPLQEVPRQDQERVARAGQLRAAERQVHAAGTRLRHRQRRGGPGCGGGGGGRVGRG